LSAGFHPDVPSFLSLIPIKFPALPPARNVIGPRSERSKKASRHFPSLFYCIESLDRRLWPFIGASRLDFTSPSLGVLDFLSSVSKRPVLPSL